MKANLILAVVALALWGSCKVQPEIAQIGQDEVIFPIGGYSGRPERDREAGFTISGPVYRNGDKNLEECERVGLSTFYKIGLPIDFHGERGPAPRELDFDEIRTKIETQVKAVADRSGIFGWYLTKEELRYWRPLEMQYLQVASEAIRRADPQKRPIWMYEPNHRTQAALEKTLPYQQIAGKGLYANYGSRKDERIWIRWTLGEQARAIAAANPEAVPYAIAEMFSQPVPEEVALIPLWVRHDCYTSLLSGVQGIVIFSFARRKGFHAWEEYYRAYAGVARELNGPLKLGSVFLKGKKIGPPAFAILSGEAETELRGGSSGLKASITLPSLQSEAYLWRDKVYFFVVNSSAHPVTIRLKESHPWKPLLEGQPVLETGGRTLQLPAFGVVALERPAV